MAIPHRETMGFHSAVSGVLAILRGVSACTAQGKFQEAGLKAFYLLSDTESILLYVYILRFHRT